MRLGFYPRLAMTGIHKNRKTYIPYILTSICMVAMFYMLLFLSRNSSIGAMRGGTSMQTVLAFGSVIIAIFSLIFLFYTNSFLIRRRKTEFGLYNVLGMSKRNLARIMIYESLIITLISIVLGLLTGVLFSKLMEMILVNILGGISEFALNVDFSSMLSTALMYLCVFAAVMVSSIIRVGASKPIELLHSEKLGEKPPKANWVIAVVGAIVLGLAYYIAISIKNPTEALLWFFVAVVMVIVATYLLFIAGSVTLCRLLQKNKRYYYKTNHFISVSSMAYRLKRNGAGLASICILSTMVLVMLSSTMCLYFGEEDVLRTRYPRNITVDCLSFEEKNIDLIDSTIDSVLSQRGLEPENALKYHYVYYMSYLHLDGNAAYLYEMNPEGMNEVPGDLHQVFVMPLCNYNSLMGESKSLSDREVLLYVTHGGLDTDVATITPSNFETLTVKETLTEFVGNGTDAMQMVSSIYIFMKDMDAVKAFRDMSLTQYTINPAYEHYYFGFDVDCDLDVQTQLLDEIFERLNETGNSDLPTFYIECAEQNRLDFYATFGGMFFLGIMLGTAFILSAVLIMYYKQITEGFEDQQRFTILQNIGMTAREIKKSISSQILTVFFAPLIAAGVHVAFAFPMVFKLLTLFNMNNMELFAVITLGCFVVFALLYVCVYIATSRAYYNIIRKKSSY